MKKKINSLCGVEVSDLRKSDDERDLRLVNDSDKIIAYLRHKEDRLELLKI